jgi:hypothetical protein
MVVKNRVHAAGKQTFLGLQMTTSGILLTGGHSPSRQIPLSLFIYADSHLRATTNAH